MCYAPDLKEDLENTLAILRVYKCVNCPDFPLLSQGFPNLAVLQATLALQLIVMLLRVLEAS